jgi:hypothetical protein
MAVLVSFNRDKRATLLWPIRAGLSTAQRAGFFSAKDFPRKI